MNVIVIYVSGKVEIYTELNRVSKRFKNKKKSKQMRKRTDRIYLYKVIFNFN